MANLFRKECQGCSETKRPSRLTYTIFRSDGHLPAMYSADRQLRPVVYWGKGCFHLPVDISIAFFLLTTVVVYLLQVFAF